MYNINQPRGPARPNHPQNGNYTPPPTDDLHIPNLMREIYRGARIAGAHSLLDGIDPEQYIYKASDLPDMFVTNRVLNYKEELCRSIRNIISIEDTDNSEKPSRKPQKGKSRRRYLFKVCRDRKKRRRRSDY